MSQLYNPARGRKHITKSTLHYWSTLFSKQLSSALLSNSLWNLLEVRILTILRQTDLSLSLTSPPCVVISRNKFGTIHGRIDCSLFQGVILVLEIVEHLTIWQGCFTEIKNQFWSYRCQLQNYYPINRLFRNKEYINHLRLCVYPILTDCILDYNRTTPKYK